MTDLNPEIWENETLGKAAATERLDRLEKQQHENRNARIEDREPREVVVENDFPGYVQPVNPRTGTVPSNAQVVHFADEQQNDVPVDAGPPDETAAGIDDETETDDETDSVVVDETSEEEASESEENSEVAFVGEVEDNSSQEGNNTKWT